MDGKIQSDVVNEATGTVVNVVRKNPAFSHKYPVEQLGGAAVVGAPTAFESKTGAPFVKIVILLGDAKNGVIPTFLQFHDGKNIVLIDEGTNNCREVQ